jgi:hypothetical protein
MNRDLFLEKVQYIHLLRPLVPVIYKCTRYYSITVTGGHFFTKSKSLKTCCCFVISKDILQKIEIESERSR